MTTRQARPRRKTNPLPAPVLLALGRPARPHTRRPLRHPPAPQSRLPASLRPGLHPPDRPRRRPHDIGAGTWIAHTPSSQDWFTFQDPGPDFHPFHLGPDGLTIRVQKDCHDPHYWFGGYSGGLLSSMDGHGKGFAQQYGYFEACLQTPGTPTPGPPSGCSTPRPLPTSPSPTAPR